MNFVSLERVVGPYLSRFSSILDLIACVFRKISSV